LDAHQLSPVTFGNDQGNQSGSQWAPLSRFLLVCLFTTLLVCIFRRWY